MIRASVLPLVFVPLWLCCVVANANAGEPVPGQSGSKADRPPRKVIVGTTVFGPYGKYPGLEERLDELCDLVDEMADLTAKQYPGAGWTWSSCSSRRRLRRAVRPTIRPCR